MATAPSPVRTNQPTAAPPVVTGSDNRVLLPGISWETYEALLGELEQSGTRVYMTYDQGNLEIMSPGIPHEWSKSLLGRMIETMTAELNIPIRSGGSTTVRRQLLRKGLEPDECYWVEREPQVRGRKALNLDVDPVPDLAIEVETTRNILNKLPIYAALGFAEVWRYDGARLGVVRFQPDGSHVEQERSEVFPFLPMDEIARFLDRAEETDETTWIRAFQTWVREVIAPRREAGQAGGAG